MTREEEIKQAANDYLQSEGLQCNFTEDNFAAGVFEGIIAGAQWADAHKPQVFVLEHDIEVLKSKLQAANDLNTLLTAELEKAKSPWISVRERLPRRPNSKYNYGNSFLVCREGDSAFIAIFHRNGKWYILDHMRYTEIVAPDYWMPIPELQTTK